MWSIQAKYIVTAHTSKHWWWGKRDMIPFEINFFFFLVKMLYLLCNSCIFSHLKTQGVSESLRSNLEQQNDVT